MSADSPFVTYERWVHETKRVATVTPENIGAIAAMVRAQVDYSGGRPVLVVDLEPANSRRIKVGTQVSLLGDQLMNQNGFNRDGDWTEIQTDHGPEKCDESEASA